jgi:hypothetical protein
MPFNKHSLTESVCLPLVPKEPRLQCKRRLVDTTTITRASRTPFHCQELPPAPVVFFLRAFVFTAAFFKAGFFFANFFFGVPLFLASFFLTVFFIGFAHPGRSLRLRALLINFVLVHTRSLPPAHACPRNRARCIARKPTGPVPQIPQYLSASLPKCRRVVLDTRMVPTHTVPAP